MKIIQIAPIIENQDYGSEAYGTWKPLPNMDATIYGLGDDGKLYIWSLLKNDRIKLNEPDEDGNTYYYRKKYGWKVYNS